MKWFIFVLILLCSGVYAISLSEGDSSGNLVVKKIFSDRVLVTIDNEEAVFKVGSVIKNVKLVSINNNQLDENYSKAVFEINVEEDVNEPVKQTITLIKNDGKEVLGHLIIFVRASDNVAFLNINGKDYQAKKDDSLVIDNTVINVLGLVHNSLDDKFDKVVLEVGKNIKPKKDSMLSVTGNVVKDYSVKSFNAVRQVPITGKVVAEASELGENIVEDNKNKSLSLFRRLLNWMLGK